jgi:hypothetical protein
VWSIPVVVALAVTTPDGPAVTIVRRAHSDDVIVLDPAMATAERLSESLRALARLRHRQGVVADENRSFRLLVRSNLKQPFPEPRSWTAFLDRELDELRRAEPRQVAGVGVAKVIELRLLQP